MCRKLINLVCVVLVLIMAAGIPAGAAVSLEVVNPSFELPGTFKQEFSVGTPGTVPGWAKADLTTSTGVRMGSPSDGLWHVYMGKDATIFNLTEFVIETGDEFQLVFDAMSSGQGCTLEAQLYYDDAGNRQVVATIEINLADYLTQYETFTVDFSADDVPASIGHKLGIQYNHIFVPGLWPDENVWARIDNVHLTLLTPLMRAQNPYPEHESSYENSIATLTWIPGPNVPTVDSYQVYFSENWADVNDGTAAADIGPEPEGQGSVSTPSYSVSDLVTGKTYYWRIDTVIGANVYRGSIWNFTVKPVLAYNPDPENGDPFVAVEPLLSWEAGTGAVEGHVVFFGTDFNDVNNAPVGTSGEPPFRAYLTNPANTNWAPLEAELTLETSKTYYWRIDAVESTSPETIHKGEVWSFTTVPIKGLGSITRDVWENIEGVTVADLTDNENYPESPTWSDEQPNFEAPPVGTVNVGVRQVIPGTSLIPYEYILASSPRPSYRATDVPRGPILSWTPGKYACPAPARRGWACFGIGKS